VSKPLLILDVDETLVYAVEHPLENRGEDFRVGPFAVYRRPHLAEFLAAVAEWYELAVWSSASGSYVSGVVSALFRDTSSLRFVWSCGRCTRRYDAEGGAYLYAKNLKKVCKLGYGLEGVLMVDDSPEKLGQHYGNHIRVRPFTGDMADTELRDLLPFLEWLRGVENVRTEEKRHWRQFKRRSWPTVEAASNPSPRPPDSTQPAG
jgi:RNA polymerase II subunit A small phosphatase-like protein